MHWFQRKRRPPPPVSFWPDEPLMALQPRAAWKPASGALVILAWVAGAALWSLAGQPGWDAPWLQSVAEPLRQVRAALPLDQVGQMVAALHP
ncbi:MAG TPA: hypothetical protein VGR28_11345 [Candidatus Thermoplasmatota archaeon]|jgi:hypothetical protein|nr:hypothetical protein [Candidatus Thermoplasmatota archaeon]